MNITQNAAIELLANFRIATARLLEVSLNKNSNQVKNELRRLRSQDLIQSFPFVGKSVYYTLTPGVCRSLGISTRAAGPHGAQALRHHYALADLMLSSTPSSVFLAEHDWDSIASELNQHDEPSDLPFDEFYFDIWELDDEQVIRLGVPLVDFRTEPSALLARIKSFVSAHRGNETVRRLVACKQIVFCVITESMGKADAIGDSVVRNDFEYPIRIHICPILSQI